MTTQLPFPTANGPAPKPSGRSPRALWHLGANAIVVAWLALFAVAGGAHHFLPHASWLLVHTLLLGAVTHAVVLWSGHFAASVLRLPEANRGAPAALRLAWLNAGAVTVIGGMLLGRRSAVLVGGGLVAAAVTAHTVWLVRLLRRALPGRFSMTVRYYIAAAALLPAGAALGVLMAHGGLGGDLPERLLFAHETINLLGWIGLTVAGTLITLWPTMLRTRVADGAERAGRRALPVLLAGLGAAVAAALLAPPPLAAPGVAVHAAGLVIASAPWVREARSKAPRSFAAWSVAAGSLWLAGSLLLLVGILLSTTSWVTVGERTSLLTAPLAAGWTAQVLLGALSFLVPVVLGGGPTAVREATTGLERAWPARLTITNAALLLCVLPVPSGVRVVCSVLLLAMLLYFLVLLVLTVVRSLRNRRNAGAGPVPAQTAAAPTHRELGGVALGLAVVMLAVAGGGAADVRSLPVLERSAATGADGGEVTPTGRTTTVEVTVRNMRFAPAAVDVPVGDRLVIELHNTGTDTHDLVLETGTRTDRIAPGERATLDAGVVGRNLGGWCSVVGHRQMGMVFRVRVTGGATAHDHAGTAAGSTGASAADAFDPMAVPADGFTARDAELPPTSRGPGTQVHRRTLTVKETEADVAPGVRQTLWTFGGTVPGPVLRGRVGDTFEITLVNDGTIGHSVDFHAGVLAPDRPTRTIQPGESLTYRFEATRSGVWMYHCSTMPMSLHIANGMFGAVVIDPPGLPHADREYLLVQSEHYLGEQRGTADPAKVNAKEPDMVTFNGYANQYDHDPLTATAGERVRIWVLAAGPNAPSAFHVVGGQFDTVFREGAYDLRPGGPERGGAQVLGLAPASGGFVELALPEAGDYPFVTHVMTDAERGAHGILRVR
ncbi:multicopper oxidase domain-containing protein [Streptomyces sp. DSM 41972]|uniref:Copper-containing nitrite reductase n=1 Tax=Streptomyces althioticus subsp. attaecolombicae TaxID=3075534 RepID=A0ABU3HZK2_9ACTN|nr:multicopper oxidase domain-containing protein [Streptomyces sp. DSM 41972]SCD50627.1 nitrite reductase (NO-forming) [Streptomyces sp. di50b]SCE53621.1 nitrite reductase (NO-forming) [Streptomyces sp. di188]